MKLIIKRENLELDFNVEEFVKENLLYKETTDEEIHKEVYSFICGLDDCYYYNITEEQQDEICEEVRNYIDNMEDYNLLDILQRVIECNDSLYVDTGYYETVDIIPLLKYLIKKEEGK